MSATFPVLWSLHGRTHSGALDLLDGRLMLTGREHTLSLPVAAIAGTVVERGASARLRGLASLVVRTEQHGVLTIASLGGAGSLHEVHSMIDHERERLASLRQAAGSGT